jgi:hypothetical protein
MAIGAPIMADTANAAPTAAKSEVVRDFTARIARLFSALPNTAVGLKTNYQLKPPFGSGVNRQI